MVFLYICKMLRDNTLDNYYREQSLHSLRITELTVLTLAFVSICELPRPQNNDQVFLIHWTNFVYPFGIFYAGKLLGSWGALSINIKFYQIGESHPGPLGSQISDRFNKQQMGKIWEGHEIIKLHLF